MYMAITHAITRVAANEAGVDRVELYAIVNGKLVFQWLTGEEADEVYNVVLLLEGVFKAPFGNCA